jgi:Uroporphyrinogen decarboxylase (URO-D)
MTTRERLTRVFSGLHPDRIPNVEFGYWEETITRWHSEGLPSYCTSDSSVERHLGLEGVTIFAELPVRNGLFPPFERKVIHEEADRRTIVDEEGNLCEVIAGHSSIPRYIQYGLRTRDDWEKLKGERLDPDTDGRIGDLFSMVSAARQTGKPIFFNAGSLYGWLRNWMGLEGLSVALMTDRTWVEEMMDHLTGLTLTLIERASTHLSGDLAWWWEDMCYNHGPLISPRLFHEMMIPRYRLVTGALRTCGIDINVIDCDGRIHELVPGWLEAGINCMFPLEAAHTDAFRLREEFGDRILLMGGMNKLALIAGRESIDREIERLSRLALQGRFIPCLDHRVPPDVSFENYLYYLEKKEDLLTI